jgi:hypothetical protein
VFLDKERPARKLVLFIIVTVSGVLLVQNSVYALGVYLLHNHEVGVINVALRLIGVRLSSDFVDVNLSNAVASLLVMFWNYNGYRIFVFKEGHGNDITETT